MLKSEEKPVKVKDAQPKKGSKESKVESYFQIKWLTGC